MKHKGILSTDALKKDGRTNSLNTRHIPNLYKAERNRIERDSGTNKSVTKKSV